MPANWTLYVYAHKESGLPHPYRIFLLGEACLWPRSRSARRSRCLVLGQRLQVHAPCLMLTAMATGSRIEDCAGSLHR
jgi:hypothetical protein